MTTYQATQAIAAHFHKVSPWVAISNMIDGRPEVLVFRSFGNDGERLPGDAMTSRDTESDALVALVNGVKSAAITSPKLKRRDSTLYWREYPYVESDGSGGYYAHCRLVWDDENRNLIWGEEYYFSRAIPEDERRRRFFEYQDRTRSKQIEDERSKAG